MAGWFGTETALPMSWQRLATTTSSSARPFGTGRSLQAMGELVDRETVGDRRRASAACRDATRRPAPGSGKGLRADDRPLLGGGLVHAGESCVGGRGHARLDAASAASTSLACVLRSGAGVRRGRATEGGGGDQVERGQQVAELAWRREVLVLVGDVDHLDAVARARAGRSPSATSSSGADAPAVTPTTPLRSSGSSSALVHPADTRDSPAARATFSRARVFDELAEPMTTTIASASRGDRP